MTISVSKRLKQKTLCLFQFPAQGPRWKLGDLNFLVWQLPKQQQRPRPKPKGTNGKTVDERDVTIENIVY